MSAGSPLLPYHPVRPWSHQLGSVPFWCLCCVFLVEPGGKASFLGLRVQQS